jgi:dienelactone hydrolase
MSATWLRSIAAALRRGLTPSPAAWMGGAVALHALLAFMWLWALADLAPRFGWEGLAGVAALYAYLALLGALLWLLVRLAAALHPPYQLAFFLVLPVVALFAGITWQWGAGIVLVVLLGGLSLFSGSLASFIAEPAWRAGTVIWLLLGAALLGLGVHAMLTPGADLNPALAGYHLKAPRGRTLDLPDPGKPGPSAITSFTYGPGTSLRRKEYGSAVLLKTSVVDGSKLAAQWRGLTGRLRSAYWGFDAAHMPLQGRVWMPQGAGPFPLVLIVHGNHVMTVPSEAGYAYLGEHLASQGFIVVSVDETFLNSGDSDQIDPLAMGGLKEMSARAWLLLEHLAQWRRWTAAEGPLHAKVDMERVALIGHSRGGEAVALAAVYNELDAFPGDATLPFDFHFHLRGIAAIAPTDGTRSLRSTDLTLRALSYFTLAGSLDGDLGTSFMGAAQYARVSVPAGADVFKASLYIKDANHGQFNTVWGRNDNGTVYRFLLDERPILAASAQRQIAKVYLASFLDVTLKDQHAYRALFEDPRNGAAWLPDDYLVGNYADGATRWLATYEEDADPRTGSDPVVILTGRGLGVWREDDIELKHSSLGTHVALLAWDKRMRGPAASYEIGFREPIKAADNAALVFSAAQAEIDTLPVGLATAGLRGNPDRDALDWTIVLRDASGREASLPLSHDQLLYPQLKGDPYRGRVASGPRSEPLMRRFALPLRDFLASTPQLDLDHLKAIVLVFDRSDRGAIVLDDVGLAAE